MNKVTLRLNPSEGIVAQCAATIYAAYIVAGKVSTGQEQQVMQQAIQEAVWIARTTDDVVHSDNEMG